MDELLTDECDRAATLPLERLEAEITELAANLWAATCRWLLLVGELDRREGWKSWGCKSCAHWLSWRCGVELATARDQVRVGCALADLPAVRAAFAAGELSYSKVRALVRVATPMTEGELVELARHATAAHLERIVRAYRGVRRREELEAANDRHARRFLRCEWDDDGSLVIRGRLSPEDGALVVAALEAAQDAARVPEEGVSAEMPADPRRASMADALVVMAETLLAAGSTPCPGGERSQVVVHVDAEALADDEHGDRCELEDGPSLPPETVRRLACDAAAVTLVDGAQGEPLGVGRKRRTVPPALRRALRARDQGCRFPSCTQRRFVDAHHVRHWAQGGETSLANLVLLCRHHHRLVHEGGFGLEVTGPRELVFRRPGGEPIPASALPVVAGVDVVEQNQRRGIETGPGACVALWGGEALDLGLAVDALLCVLP